MVIDKERAMSEKIAVISMMKNEADIVESFVRYYAAFADCIIIADHNSNDGTWEILEMLKAEYPFLVTTTVEQMEYIQSEIMTSLMELAANEFLADWILPMDADEFLLSEVNDDIRTVLESCWDNVLLLPWVNHEVPEDCYDRSRFLLNQPCRRAVRPLDACKVIVKGDYIRNNTWRLQQGNHGLEAVAPNSNVPDYSDSKKLILAHFPFRSKEQYISKNALGWLTNIARFSKHTHFASHWKKEFDKIAAGDINIPDIGQSIEIGNIVKDLIPLKYSAIGGNNVLSYILKLSEKVFNEYAVMKALDHAPKINLYMIVNGDFDALAITMESLIKQTFTDWKLHLILLSGIDSEIIEALNNIDSRIKTVKLSYLCKCDWNFVKFLEAGVQMNCVHLANQIIPMINHSDVDVSYSNAEKREGYIVLNTNGHNCCEGNNMIELLRKNDYRLSGGIASFLFRELGAEFNPVNYINRDKWNAMAIIETFLANRFIYVEEEYTLKGYVEREHQDRK